MTILNQLIDGLTDDSISTSNALRKFLVVGKRLKYEPITSWVNSELNGFTHVPLDDYPTYRGPFKVPVEVVFAGSFGSEQKHFITEEVVPDERGFRAANFYMYFSEPVAELEQLAQSTGHFSQSWSTTAASQLQKWSDEGRAPKVPMHGVRSVEKRISAPLIRGVIDSVRNKALLLALDLQADFPDAGEFGGPTVQDKEVEKNVNYHFETHIHGGTNTVGMGEKVTQNVKIDQGDSKALMLALEKLGLAQEDRAALGEAIAKDGNKPGEAIKEFLTRLGTGAIKIGGAVATPGVVLSVKAAITAFTGIPIP
uniref:AbiTii domain-containing protein n=1 Tax=Arthrobacter sp. TaxID=1667 RepID=UPI000EB711AC|nr:hypothetical protein [Arthrobacter sp.]AXV46399.1 hypothetical protein pA40H2_p43 [Arthrobacter sp.]